MCEMSSGQCLRCLPHCITVQETHTNRPHIIEHWCIPYLYVKCSISIWHFFVGECFFLYQLTRVVTDKVHRAVKRLCVCVCVCVRNTPDELDSCKMSIPVFNVKKKIWIPGYNCSVWQADGRTDKQAGKPLTLILLTESSDWHTLSIDTRGLQSSWLNYDHFYRLKDHLCFQMTVPPLFSNDCWNVFYLWGKIHIF